MEQRQRGRASSDAQTVGAELALLHTLLAHYARLLWDIQRTRIALSNRAAARCGETGLRSSGAYR